MQFHENGKALLFPGIEWFRPAPQITAHHITEQVAGQPPLAGIYEGKTLLELLSRCFRDFHLFHAYFLIDAGHGGNKFDAGGQAADLILPAAAGAHDLLHVQDDIVNLLLRGFSSQKFKQSLHAGAGKNAAGAKPGALGDSNNPGGKADAARPAGCRFPEGSRRLRE